MKHTECKDCELSNGDCGYHFKMDGKTNYDIASLSACDKYGNCEFFKSKAKPQGDLINREDLKKALHKFFDGKVIDEPTYILRDVFCYIDGAPAVDTTEQEEAAYNEGYAHGLETKIPQGGQVVPDMLQGWKYEERPQGDIFPMKIVAGKCPIEAGENCPLRPQGEWINESISFGCGDAECSKCHKKAEMIVKDNGWGYDYFSYNFCPNCGAKMQNGGAEV